MKNRLISYAIMMIIIGIAILAVTSAILPSLNAALKGLSMG